MKVLLIAAALVASLFCYSNAHAQARRIAVCPENANLEFFTPTDSRDGKIAEKQRLTR